MPTPVAVPTVLSRRESTLLMPLPLELGVNCADTEVRPVMLGQLMVSEMDLVEPKFVPDPVPSSLMETIPMGTMIVAAVPAALAFTVQVELVMEPVELMMPELAA